MLKDWKTTLAGLLASSLPYVRGFVPEAYQGVVDAVTALSLALMGVFAGDRK